MKRVFFIFSMVCCLNIVIGQANNDEEKLSQIEKFAAQEGVILKREYKNIGWSGNTQLVTAVITNLETGEKQKGLRFEMNRKSNRTSGYLEVAYIFFLDEEEIADLIQAATKLNEITQVPIDKPKLIKDYVEYEYKNKSGFALGTYYDNTKWQSYIKFYDFVKKPKDFLGKNGFEKLIPLLKTSLEELSKK